MKRNVSNTCITLLKTILVVGCLVSWQISISYSQIKKEIDPKEYLSKIQQIKFFVDKGRYDLADSMHIVFNESYLAPNDYLDLKRVIQTGRIQKYKKEPDKAIGTFLNVEKRAVEAGEMEIHMEVIIQLIEYYRSMGRMNEAEQYYIKGVQFYDSYKLNNEDLQFGLWNRYAAVLNGNSEHKKSIGFSRKALHLAKASGNIDRIASCYNEIGFTHGLLKHVDSALLYYEFAKKSFLDNQSYTDGLNVMQNIYLLKLQNGYFSKEDRLESLDSIIAFKVNFNVSFGMKNIYEERFFALKELGRYKEALDAQEVFYRCFFELIDGTNFIEIEKIKEQYENEKLLRSNEKITFEAESRGAALDKAQSQLKWIVLVSVVFLIGFTIVIYLWYRLKKTHQRVVIKEQQKTVLIQEIHHRVKNNLQFVRSMLEMQMHDIEMSNNTITNGESLRNVSARIDALSLVHEMLYLDEDQMGVVMSDYISKLMMSCQDLFVNKLDVRFRVEVESVEFSAEIATSVGVICSEMYNNAVKHAFKLGLDNYFSLFLTCQDSDCTLVIMNNGKLDSEESQDGLGMHIIDIFLRQLKGSMRMEKVDYYKCIIEFKRN